MSSIKKLAGQTVIYGISSIVGRFLYFLLTPLYTNTAIFAQADYGVATDVFAFIGLAMIFFTYRMELAFFRFGSDSKEALHKTFNTSFSSILISTVLLGFIVWISVPGLAASRWFQYPDFAYVLYYAVGILCLDALTEIPFAKLRMEERALRFAGIRLIGIGINLGLNLFFLLLCPYLQKNGMGGAMLDLVYDPGIGIGYIFIANVMASLVVMFLLLPTIRDFRFYVDWDLWRQMIRYALPLIVVGLSFVVNEMLDRKLLIALGRGDLTERRQALGVYGANYKLAMVLSLFTQAFRYGAEPFFFKQRQDVDAKIQYAVLAKYFLWVSLLGFLSIVLFLDVFKYFIGPAYWKGLHVVPVLLMANLFLGLYYNFSVWYKLTDKTYWGAMISGAGALVTILLNVMWIPIFGYTGSAWATLICYAGMAILCWQIGRNYYPIPYPRRRMLFYISLALLIYVLQDAVPIVSGLEWWIWRGALWLGFVAAFAYLEWEALKRLFGKATQTNSGTNPK